MKPHERLDAALRRRIEELDMTWGELADAAGVHEVTLRAIRRGENRPSPRTQRRLESALRWARGSVQRIYAGGDPEVLPAEETRPRTRSEELLAAWAARDARRAHDQAALEELRELADRVEIAVADDRQRRAVLAVLRALQEEGA